MLNFFIIKKKTFKLDVSIKFDVIILMNDQIKQYNYLKAFSNWLKMF